MVGEPDAVTAKAKFEIYRIPNACHAPRTDRYLAPTKCTRQEQSRQGGERAAPRVCSGHGRRKNKISESPASRLSMRTGRTRGHYLLR